jgi:hypothetical protein
MAITSGARRGAVIVVTTAACAAAVVGCGGDDDLDTLGTADQGTVAGTTDQAAAPAGDAGASDSTGGECPDLVSVSAAYGAEMVFDEGSMTGAAGLVFCPYEEVVSPDDTTGFGTQRMPDIVSVTLTDLDITAEPSGEALTGLGERAFWSEGAGELTVWTGERGVIVSMPFAPETGDPRSIAVAIASLVPGVAGG